MKDINLIRKIAWSFHKSTGLDWDDLFQEAALAYLEALQSYDKRKGKLSTHAWHCIVSRLKNYWKKEREWQEPLVDIEQALPQETNFYSFWQKIPESLHNPVSIILEGASEMDSYFLDVLPKEEKVEKRLAKTSARITIKRLLRKAGYDSQEITGTIHTLEIAVKNF